MSALETLFEEISALLLPASAGDQAMPDVIRSTGSPKEIDLAAAADSLGRAGNVGWLEQMH